MNLGWDLAAALPGLRTEAESRMRATVVVGHVTEVTGPGYAVSKVLASVAYDGVARIKFPRSSVNEPIVADQPVAFEGMELHLPAGTTGVEVDMWVVVESDQDDPGLAGRSFRIQGRPTAGAVTAARFVIEETGELVDVGS